MASSSETSETTTSPAVDARDVCDVAIVGAGPGGLDAALALQRRGYDVRVFERREAFRPAGVAVFIWPHGLEHLKRIDAATCARGRRRVSGAREIPRRVFMRRART